MSCARCAPGAGPATRGDGTKVGPRVDYIGFAPLALGVGPLQMMLDRGPEDDWFASSFITALEVAAAVCLLALAIDD